MSPKKKLTTVATASATIGVVVAILFNVGWLPYRFGIIENRLDACEVTAEEIKDISNDVSYIRGYIDRLKE